MVRFSFTTGVRITCRYLHWINSNQNIDPNLNIDSSVPALLNECATAFAQIVLYGQYGRPSPATAGLLALFYTMLWYCSGTDNELEICFELIINKRRAVAVQTARSRCKVLSIQYVYYFTAYQRQRTLVGIGVITKLYFASFAAFKESITLNLTQRSFKVIHFGGN